MEAVEDVQDSRLIQPEAGGRSVKAAASGTVAHWLLVYH